MKNFIRITFASLIMLISQTTLAQSYGIEFDIKDVEPVTVVLSSPDTYLEKPMILEGELTGVCQKAGCWARIGENPTSENALFVKFGDHDFTIPVDMEGSVVVHGKLIKRETSIQQLKHLAKDAGKRRKEIRKIKSPKIEYWFMADGLQSI